uniref:Uncharacterized protein n=1 Tax=Cannabis sativa TaxID=3483 RepID=A0A803PZL1_CANSA
MARRKTTIVVGNGQWLSKRTKRRKRKSIAGSGTQMGVSWWLSFVDGGCRCKWGFSVDVDFFFEASKGDHEREERGRSWQRFGSLSKKIVETQKEIDKFLSANARDVRVDEVKAIELELDDLINKDELYWKQRSRSEWMMEKIIGEVAWYFTDIFQTANPTNEQIQPGPRVTHLFFANDSLVFGRANKGDTETIKRILLTYDATSSQKIDFEKSAITFSLNVQQVDQDGVLSVLGLTSAATYNKYLGSPMVIGRNKKQAFEGICEKDMELLKCGPQRSIGDGIQVRTFKDPWLPHPRSFQPITRGLNDNCQVSEFILPSGTWNVGKLQQVFLPMDVHIIFSIPLARRGVEDGWCWHYDRDRVYNVKSGYALAWSL